MWRAAATGTLGTGRTYGARRSTCPTASACRCVVVPVLAVSFASALSPVGQSLADMQCAELARFLVGLMLVCSARSNCALQQLCINCVSLGCSLLRLQSGSEFATDRDGVLPGLLHRR